MKTKREVKTGGVFGRWTVLEPGAVTPKGEQKWRCRCSCGTEREVLGRSLLYGGSLSCGCLARERSSECSALDLNGKTFGDLTVIGPSGRKTAVGVLWRCRCACGKEIDYPATLLYTGKRKHCGCKTVKNYAYTDITGKKFNRLTALYRLQEADAYGSVIWHCRCDCGNEVDVSYNSLAYSSVMSCGCKKREHDKALGGFLTHVAGTSVDMLKSKKLPKNNTTGVKGVYLIKGKYVAKIVFQKKQYFLGAYDDLESAREARLEAEEIINERVVAYYQRWKALADADPVWAAENPVRILADKDPGGHLRITMQPVLDECEESAQQRRIV